MVLFPLITQYTRLMLLLLFGYICDLAFWVGLLDTPKVSMGILILDFFLVGQLCMGQIIFGPLPCHPKIHHRDYIEGIPLNAGMSGASQTCDGISRVYSHCTSPESIVQT